jgi:hypothetical protein
MREVVRGRQGLINGRGQGHRDAGVSSSRLIRVSNFRLTDNEEGFSMYAMGKSSLLGIVKLRLMIAACWVNAVSWYSGYNPKERVNP